MLNLSSIQGMKYRFALIICLVLAPFYLKAQADSAKGPYVPYFQQLQASTPKGGKVTVHQDSEIEFLCNQVGYHNAKTKGMPGFRVRIYRDNRQQSRQKSMDVIAEFIAKYPDIPCYRYYDNPYFKVSVGDFRNRNEAMKFYKQLSKEFAGAFIVQETINFPKVD